LEIYPRQDWLAVLEVLRKEKGIAVLLGKTDTGKSTLAKLLISHLCEKEIKTALVDADIGQSFLGPPTTIGLSVFNRPPDWDRIPSPEIFFVGSTSPEGQVPIHLRGIRKMADRATAYGAEVVLVDTTGFVSGEGGKDLKRRKIELLQPAFLIALQRSEEVEHILTLYTGCALPKILRLSPSEAVRSRPAEERALYRKKKFEEYFHSAEPRELAVSNLRIEGTAVDSNGLPIPLERALGMKGLLLGLKDPNDNTLALGRIEDFFEEEKRLLIYTTLEDLDKVKVLQLSSLKLTPSFIEERV
jgi:polynucleotide 5'-hydroxyl-kinase GRC3/NOL9